MTKVLILGGGPDAEREISIASATAIQQACLDAGFDAELNIIDQPDLATVRSWNADVIFPALHGRFGEGGTLQLLLQQAGHTFIGSKSKAARLAMDKIGTKLIASRCSIPTAAACIFDPCDIENPERSMCPFEFPVVIKPVADGSSVGLHICNTQDQWKAAVTAVGDDLTQHPSRVYMIERMVPGRELTVSVVADGKEMLRALPIIEIAPASGVYDFNAKYSRKDTVYTSNPDLADGVVREIQEQALRLCVAIGVRHLARVDFMMSDDMHWSVLEVNTMPGFTGTSLLPMAAQADGMSISALCAHLVHHALPIQVS